MTVYIKTETAVEQLKSVALASIIGASLFAPNWAFAHAGENHDDDGITVSVDDQEDIQNTENILPEELANIGGAFSLVNHLGEPVTDQTYAGKHMLVFFGYSNCQVMCPISFKRIADALTILEDDQNEPLTKLNTLVITVDPKNDSPAHLRESLASYHPAMTGLTGTLDQLKPVYKAYKQKPSILEETFNDKEIVTHTSYFYLMGPDGKLQTFFPPVLSSESMANVLKRYLPI